MQPLAITGQGVVSPLGVGREAFVSALAAGDDAQKAAFGVPTILDASKVGEARAAEFGRRNAVEGELLVRVRPRKVVAQKNIAD